MSYHTEILHHDVAYRTMTYQKMHSSVMIASRFASRPLEVSHGRHMVLSWVTCGSIRTSSGSHPVLTLASFGGHGGCMYVEACFHVCVSSCAHYMYACVHVCLLSDVCAVSYTHLFWYSLISVSLHVCIHPLMRRRAGWLYRTTGPRCSIPNNDVAKRASKYQSTH